MVKIITDTLSCLRPEEAERYHIPVIPQIINFGEESYREGLDIDHKTFLDKLVKSKDLPKTAAPPPEWFKDIFNEMVADGDTILCIHPSAELSGTVRSASVAAQDFPGADIRIIDTKIIASPLGVMVLCAARWAQAGMDADTIVKKVEDMSRRCIIYFLVDTLEYLARGGRIGGASALVGSILQIKPILTLRDGRTEVLQRERTHRRALMLIQERVKEEFPGQGEDYGYLSVLNAGVYDQAKALADELKAAYRLEDVPIVDVPPAIITHGGPGIIGVTYFTK